MVKYLCFGGEEAGGAGGLRYREPTVEGLEE
jgi:hypothetical protein